MGAQQRYNHTHLNGVATYNLNREFTWTNRFIIISGGVHIDSNNSGYWDISMPAVGATIPVASGGTRTVVAASAASTGGVLLNPWDALWYRLPLEAGNASVPANFMIVPYNSTFDADEHWICVAAVEDFNDVKLCDGSHIMIGESSGTKQNMLLRMNAQAESKQAQGVQFVAPGLAAVTPSAVAYGFNGALRTIGFGPHNEGFSSGYFDIQPPTAGTAIYDQTGTVIARTWRASVAGDRMNQLGSGGSQYGALSAAAVVDLLAEESLWFRASPNSTTAGTWHLFAYSAAPSAGFHPGVNWIKVAYRHNMQPSVVAFGNHRLNVGDASVSDMAYSATASRMRSAINTASRGTATVAFTPASFFAGTGANGIVSSAYGAFLKFTSANVAYYGISEGWSSALGAGQQGSQSQYLQLNMPAAGTAIPVLGSGTITRVVDATWGIPLGAWDILWFIPHLYTGGTGSTNGDWVISSYAAGGAVVPHYAMKVAQYLNEGSFPNTVQSAMPFDSTNVNNDSRGSRVKFLDQYLPLGYSTGPAGADVAALNLGHVGHTGSYRAMLFGAAAAGATGLGTSAISYPGWPAGYRLRAGRDQRTLSTIGLIQFPTAGTLTAGNIVAFLPGVQLDKNHLTHGLLSAGTGNGYYSIDLRLTNAIVGGVGGAQLTVSGIEGGNRAVVVGAWIDLRALDGTTLD